MFRRVTRFCIPLSIAITFLILISPKVNSSEIVNHNQEFDSPSRPTTAMTLTAAPTPTASSPQKSSTAQPPATPQPAPVRPATAKPAAKTAPPVTQAPPMPAPTWEMIFDEWSHKLPGHFSIQDDGAWGMTTFDMNLTVHIARRTPQKYLVAIMLHESMHVRQVQVFHGDYELAVATLAPYGGVEINADCGTILMGGNFTGYAHGKCTSEQKQAARSIMDNRKP